jgi:hypothetical protein
MFVMREDGKIVGAFAGEQEFATEELSDDSAELVAFLNPPPPSVESVSSRQFKLQLLAQNLLDPVEAWVNTQSRAIQVAYENSGTFVRNAAMMADGFAAMGFTAQQIDDFFTAASKL